MDDEGTKRERRMILSLAITGHFTRQKSHQFAKAETDVYLHRWSTEGNIDIGSVNCNDL